MITHRDRIFVTYKILEVLIQENDQMISSLARKLRMGSQVLTDMLIKMQNLSWVEVYSKPYGKNRDHKFIKITEKARKIYKELNPIFEAWYS